MVPIVALLVNFPFKIFDSEINLLQVVALGEDYSTEQQYPVGLLLSELS